MDTGFRLAFRPQSESPVDCPLRSLPLGHLLPPDLIPPITAEPQLPVLTVSSSWSLRTSSLCPSVITAFTVSRSLGLTLDLVISNSASFKRPFSSPCVNNHLSSGTPAPALPTGPSGPLVLQHSYSVVPALCCAWYTQPMCSVLWPNTRHRNIVGRVCLGS